MENLASSSPNFPMHLTCFSFLKYWVTFRLNVKQQLLKTQNYLQKSPKIHLHFKRNNYGDEKSVRNEL